MSSPTPEGRATRVDPATMAVNDPWENLTLYDQTGDVYSALCAAYAHNPNAKLLEAVHSSANLLFRSHVLLATELAEDGDSRALHSDLTKLNSLAAESRATSLEQLLKSGILRRIIARKLPTAPAYLAPIICEPSDIEPEEEAATRNTLAVLFSTSYKNAVDEDTRNFITQADAVHRTINLLRRSLGAATIVATVSIGTKLLRRK